MNGRDRVQRKYSSEFFFTCTRNVTVIGCTRELLESKHVQQREQRRIDIHDAGGDGGGGGTFRVSFLISVEDNAPNDARIEWSIHNSDFSSAETADVSSFHRFAKCMNDDNRERQFYFFVGWQRKFRANIKKLQNLSISSGLYSLYSMQKFLY